MSILLEAVNHVLAGVTQRPFWSAAEIRDFVSAHDEKAVQLLYKPRPGAPEQRSPRNLRAMKFFALEKEQTWIVCDELMAWIVHDDRRWEKPRIKLGVPAESMLPVRVREGSYAEGVGTLYFGDRHQIWLYSEDLFLDEAVTERMSRFLETQAQPRAA